MSLARRTPRERESQKLVREVFEVKTAHISRSSALFWNLEAQLRVTSFLSSFRDDDFNPFSLLSCSTISFFTIFEMNVLVF